MIDVVERLNRRTMQSGSTVKAYSTDTLLTAAEQASLDEVRDEALGKPILDLGVGAGRTIKPLLEVSRDYVGIDNSEAMLAAARLRFPGVRLEHSDARNLAHIPSGSIFLAIFSCNGIDMVTHPDRLEIFKAVFRVLQPGGVFLFSTHNQNCDDHDGGFRFPDFRWSGNPARLAVRGLRFARDLCISAVNRLRFSRHDVRTASYSIINDVCHNYGTMLYYVSLQNQRLQLARLGFLPLANAYGGDGRLIVGDTRDSSMAFVARKPVGPFGGMASR